MPYEGEFAQHRSVQRLVQNQRIQQLLGAFRIQHHSTGRDSIKPLALEELPHSSWSPNWVLAVDGSHIEVKVENGYPQAEASYITVASVLLDLAKIRQLDQNRPVDPHEFRKTEHAQSIDCALPSCNVVFEGDQSARDSLRHGLFDVFTEHRMSPDSESLLETYQTLLAYKPGQREQRCPYEDCPFSKSYVPQDGRFACSCPLRRPVYSTDALRIHEGMNLEGTNGAMFAEIMQVWERVWIVHFLRTLEGKRWLHILKDMAIILDGPLAVFGHPAWLSHAISRELQRLNDLVRTATDGQDILLLGIEKTGSFVQHFEDLDRQSGGEFGRLSSQSVILIDDQYIKQHIISSDSVKPYGLDTYFGRKFLYKTKSGARIVGSVPFLSDSDLDTSQAKAQQFPRLGDALRLLNQLVSSRYPNALSPLVSAHAEAAIPLNLGGKVLEKLAKDLMHGKTR